MKNATVYVLAKLLTKIVLHLQFKQVETLGVSTNNKFSFNSRTKISVEKLVRYSVTSLEWLHILITIIKKESR